MKNTAGRRLTGVLKGISILLVGVLIGALLTAWAMRPRTAYERIEAAVEALNGDVDCIRTAMWEFDMEHELAEKLCAAGRR